MDDVALVIHNYRILGLRVQISGGRLNVEDPVLGLYVSVKDTVGQEDPIHRGTGVIFDDAPDDPVCGEGEGAPAGGLERHVGAENALRASFQAHPK
jgi:hypothetical protein